MYVSKHRAKLALALLTLTAAVPAYAGRVCDLIDGDVAVEDGGGSTANGFSAVACGVANQTDGNSATAIGISNVVNADNSAAFGLSNTINATGTSAMAIGNNNFVDGNQSVAIGNFNSTIGPSSTAMGFENIASGEQSVAIGASNVAQGNRSVAIGSQSQALADNSVALGSGAIADRANSVSIGAAGAEKQITHVAAATQGTDAVNLNQMTAGDTATLSAANAYTDSKFAGLDFAGINDRFGAIEQRLSRQDARIDRIGAMGGALAGMAMNSANLSGRNRVAVGVGSQGGRQAFAVGYQRALLGTRASVSLGAAFSGNDNTVSGGAGYSW